MDPLQFLMIFIVILVIVSLVSRLFLRRIRRAGKQWPGEARVMAGLDRLKNSPQPVKEQRVRRVKILLELTIIFVWAAYVGQPYLNPNPMMWPGGSEIGIQANTHYFWVAAQRCGLCALWDGTINGGMPAMADPFGAKLHPVVAMSTLLFGVINGVKLTLVLCFWLAGVAQWWIARTLKLGWLPRLWSAGMAVVGGHLAARMATGQIAMIVSTVSGSLALAAALHLSVTGKRRSAVALGVLGAVAIMSGHGYVQLTLVSWAPTFLFFLLDRSFHLRPLWREYALAVGLSLLLSAVFLIPTVHFLPNYVKDTDPALTFVQPLEYAPLNLVVRDNTFMTTAILGKSAEPELHAMYIGWAPIILATLTLFFARRKDARVLLCLVTGIVISYLLATGIILAPLIKLSDFFAGFRHASLMVVLAIPAILALAAYGLDGLLKLHWPQVMLTRHMDNSAPLVKINLSWILLVPLIWSLNASHEFTREFVGTTDMTTIYQFYKNVINDLNGPSLQWTAPLYGEGNMVEPALHFGAKLTQAGSPQRWKDREHPEPKVLISRGGDYPDAVVVNYFNNVPVYEFPNRDYAYVEVGGQQVSCVATGSNGDINVDCVTDRAGTLIVQENSVAGWLAAIDQVSVPLNDERWLSVAAPAGSHHYEFRYRPWDVVIGLILSLIGLCLAIWLWVRASHASRPPAADDRITPPAEMHDRQESEALSHD